MKRSRLNNFIMATLFAGINVVLANVSLTFQLPLFLDTLGTMLSTRLIGLRWGFLTIAVGSILNSFYDPYAIPYSPTYVATAIMVWIVFKNEKLRNLPLVLKALIITLPSSIIGGLITAYIFGGITSSGTSIVISLLTKAGLSLAKSAMIVQIFFEFIDKIVILILMESVLEFFPDRILEKFPNRLK